MSSVHTTVHRSYVTGVVIMPMLLYTIYYLMWNDIRVSRGCERLTQMIGERQYAYTYTVEIKLAICDTWLEKRRLSLCNM